MRAKSLQLCLTLCDLRDCSLPGSSFHGILQARKREWVVKLSSRGLFPLGDLNGASDVSCIGRRFFFFYHVLLGKPPPNVLTTAKSQTLLGGNDPARV